MTSVAEKYFAVNAKKYFAVNAVDLGSDVCSWRRYRIPSISRDTWGDFLRKGRNKKNDEKSKYYSNKSFDL